MILYHGSNVEIVQIDLGKSRPNKDFGKGFYLSADYQQAMRMAQFIFLNRNNRSSIQQHNYDIIYGPIANDYVGAQMMKYEEGDITLAELLEYLKYMKGITFQYFFGTECAIAKLHKQ